MMALLNALFLGLASSVPGRVLAALGMGWLSFASLTTAVSTLVQSTFSSWNALPAAVYQLASLAGFTDSLGILAAALTTRAALSALPRLGKLA